MSVPLATLRRQSKTVWLHDCFSSLPAGRGPALTFGRADDAGAYLCFWKNEAAAVTALRYALYRCEHSPSVFSFSDQQVIQALAAKLARGALVAAPDSSTLINLDALPDRPPVPPLLPLLEEVQIEGAEVLPEIEQTLEQIDLTLGSIDLAGASLAPTPSKVPLIETAMTDASRSVTKTLDDL
jgi:hypothetical protein